MGLRLKGDSIRVERLKNWVPVWAPLVHARLRRLSLAFSGSASSWSADVEALPRWMSGPSWLLPASTRQTSVRISARCCGLSSRRRSKTTTWMPHFAIFSGASEAFLCASAHCFPPSDHFFDSQRSPRRSMSSDLASS